MSPPPAGSTDPLVGDLRRAGLPALLVLHHTAREPAYGNRRLAAEPAPRLDRIARAIRAVSLEVLDAR